MCHWFHVFYSLLTLKYHWYISFPCPFVITPHLSFRYKTIFFDIHTIIGKTQEHLQKFLKIFKRFETKILKIITVQPTPFAKTPWAELLCHIIFYKRTNYDILYTAFFIFNTILYHFSHCFRLQIIWIC